MIGSEQLLKKSGRQGKWTNLIKLDSAGVLRIKDISGVYRLSYFSPVNQKYYVYYVGQATDLNDRLGDHLPDNEEDRCCQRYLDKYDCFFRAAAVSRQDNRDGIEATLFDHFEPNCSERKPDVDPINININN